MTTVLRLCIFNSEQMYRFLGDMSEEIVIFRTDDESINVEVRFEDETAWLTQDRMSVLFSKSKSTINEHIKNVFKEGELDEKEVVRKFRITTPHGAIEGKTAVSRGEFLQP